MNKIATGARFLKLFRWLNSLQWINFYLTIFGMLHLHFDLCQCKNVFFMSHFLFCINIRLYWANENVKRQLAFSSQKAFSRFYYYFLLFVSPVIFSSFWWWEHQLFITMLHISINFANDSLTQNAHEKTQWRDQTTMLKRFYKMQ